MQLSGHRKNQITVGVILLLLIVASLTGRRRSSYQNELLIAEVSGYKTDNLIMLNPAKWRVTGDSTSEAAWLYVGEGVGYNGPISVIAITDSIGKIIEVRPMQHNETHSYYRKLERQGFFNSLSGTLLTDYLSGNTPDVISGATISSSGIISAMADGFSAGENIALSNHQKIRFGLAEALVILLFVSGVLLRFIRATRLKKVVYWSSLATSFIFLGFLFNIPLTLSRFASISAGYLPDPSNELHLYLLLGGSILALLLTGRNTYCHSVCPFGAAQEFLGLIGGAKPFRRQRLFRLLRRVSYTAAFIILLAALFMRNPSITQYEVFGAFFQLTATTTLFVILFIFNVLSLLIKRPYCHFMCPVGGVMAFFRLIHHTVTANSTIENKGSVSLKILSVTP